MQRCTARARKTAVQGLCVEVWCSYSQDQKTDSIVVGSILTAELSAIRYALERAASMPDLKNFRNLFIFSDSQSALDLVKQ